MYSTTKLAQLSLDQKTTSAASHLAGTERAVAVGDHFSEPPVDLQGAVEVADAAE